MTKYSVKCEVILHGEKLPVMKEVNAKDFPQAVEKVINNIIETMGVSVWDIDNFDMIS